MPLIKAEVPAATLRRHEAEHVHVLLGQRSTRIIDSDEDPRVSSLLACSSFFLLPWKSLSLKNRRVYIEESSFTLTPGFVFI
jgi:hypothetical protein